MIAIRGGARIDIVNHGLVTLYAGPEALVIDATLGERYVFPASDVRRLEPFVWIPILGWGIRIIHSCPDIPEEVIFSSIWPPRWVLRDIARGGFVAKGQRKATSVAPSPDRPDRASGRTGRGGGERPE
jgi:hypothetical protein